MDHAHKKKIKNTCKPAGKTNKKHIGNELVTNFNSVQFIKHNIQFL